MADHYRIILQPEAYEGMESAYAYIARDSPERAREWAAGLMDAIDSLKALPERCSLAPENAYFSQEIRQLPYGNRSAGFVLP